MIAFRVWVSPKAEAGTCQCPEAYVPTYRDGFEHVPRRLPAARLHDCQYIRLRNALIPAAQKIAKRKSPHGGYEWSAAYTAAMECLAAEARASGLL